MGPLEFLVLAYPGAVPGSAAYDAVAPLRASADLRVVDALLVTRTEDGAVTATEPGRPLTEGVGAGGEDGRLIGAEDAEAAAELVAPGSCALLVLVEHLWARAAQEAVEASGGRVAAALRIPADRVERARADHAAATAAGPGSGAGRGPLSA